MDLTGKVIAICNEQQGVSKKTGKPFYTKDYVIHVEDGQYPYDFCFSVFGKEKNDEFAIKINDEVQVFFNVSAHQFNGRWYNSINAWRVQKMNGASPAQNIAQQMNQFASKPQATQQQGTNVDDLPF